MSKKTMKILTAICMIVLIVCVCSSVFAANSPGELGQNSSTSDAFDDAGRTIMGWVRGVGMIVAVVILMVLGIKYMMGSASEKAEYKKTMMPYLIGAVLLFAAVNIAGWIYDAANDVTNTDTKTTGSLETVQVEKA